MLWFNPMRTTKYPDALAGWQPDFSIRIRPASKVEPTPALRHPVWSNCTLPVIVYSDYLYNYKMFMTHVLPGVDDLFRVKQAFKDGTATIALATPAGLALEPYHALTLSAYSRRPVVPLSELGRRGMEATAADWAGEGVRVHCYNRVIACKLRNGNSVSPAAAAAVVENMNKLPGLALPEDPLGFGGPLVPGSDTLRVVIEARTGGWRTIKNTQDILNACNAAGASFSAAQFKRIVCKLLPRSYDTSPPVTGPALLSSAGAKAYRDAVAAVRSAHLFVATAGTTVAHAFFMQPEAGAGLIEVRPCGWGTKWSDKSNGDQDSMAVQLGKDDSVRYFAYNVEDPSQCSPPDYEPELRAVMAANNGTMPLPVVHQLADKSPPRYTPEALMSRDQHVSPKPGPLLDFIRHAAALLVDKAAYQAARNDRRVHGYAVAQGVLLAEAGVKDAGAAAAGADPTHMLRAP
ncbi:hypothetical protein HYH03_008280 [Edaphochlamys debaryana]|uniref:Uncharacterized protein n=1 Tax=Edaphochlamys debaryana TaxID=47281 RepID=A0A835Y2G6_9CHLO|nr:hypothetical protein HYH03_008280 [Edaphochlamys debaryana]|eukprot:KAG2493463.1 hypothetical protein HYH03_008280 [Edaphochlamys debaryana]